MGTFRKRVNPETRASGLVPLVPFKPDSFKFFQAKGSVSFSKTTSNSCRRLFFEGGGVSVSDSAFSVELLGSTLASSFELLEFSFYWLIASIS